VNRFDFARLMTPTRHPWGRSFFLSGAPYHPGTDRILRLSRDLPMIVEVVDTQENVDRGMTRRDEMIVGGRITLEKVTVMRYTYRHAEQGRI